MGLGTPNKNPSKYGIYKVTAANIKTTNENKQLYNLQLDHSHWVTQFIPKRQLDQTSSSLYKKYKDNNNSLEFLVGTYIDIGILDSKYGKNFSRIRYFDVLNEFKKLLDQANGKAFSFQANIYGFLIKKGYITNPDSSITLLAPYEKYNIKASGDYTICYSKDPEFGTVTLENLSFIFDKFYKGKDTSNLSDYDRSEEYYLGVIDIGISGEKFHKSQTKTLHRYNRTVLRVGDQLTRDQLAYLSSFDNKKLT